ncbi:glycogenin-2-like [Plectropomus leopardus]|uniref:glycogenin-2-like n=1 Tax=Plectropomus leopardus TaxID=160734 RepID=UPI001C4C99B0|nr:glycogenin-2-like [Plectropomus leopardus]
MPFTENLDCSNSLLAHFSPPSEMLHSPSEPERRFSTENTAFKEDSKTTEKTEIQDPDFGAEGMERSACASDTDTYTQTQRAVDAEAERLEHRRLWEVGRADYLGRDAFENIQKMLDRFLD